MNFDQPNIPTPENNQEKIEKGKVLEMLRANGFEHPETREMVIKWTEQQEALVEKENTSRAGILFNIDRADLYVAVGDTNGALECLEDARMQAHQENEEEIYNQIMKKMDAIEVENTAVIRNEKGQVAVTPENIPEKNKKGQVPATLEEIALAEEWLSRHPVQVETKNGPEQKVSEFENMVLEFETMYSLEELTAIVDLSADPDRKHPIRDLAKKSANPILALLNTLKNETTITNEEYDELERKWKSIAKAIGWVVKGGMVDHNR